MKPTFFNFIQGSTTADELHRQRRELATKLHPDKEGGSHHDFVAMEQEYKTLLGLINTAPSCGEQQATPKFDFTTLGPALSDALRNVVTTIVFMHPDWISCRRDQVLKWLSAYISSQPLIFSWLKMLIFKDATTPDLMAEKMVDMVMDMIIEKFSDS